MSQKTITHSYTSLQTSTTYCTLSCSQKQFSGKKKNKNFCFSVLTRILEQASKALSPFPSMTISICYVRKAKRQLDPPSNGNSLQEI